MGLHPPTQKSVTRACCVLSWVVNNFEEEGMLLYIDKNFCKHSCLEEDFPSFKTDPGPGASREGEASRGGRASGCGED